MLDIKTIALARNGRSGAGVELDATLSKAGKAADAAAVGDALNSLSAEIANCIKAPSTAEVGQTIVVKTVDNDGKPTEFEAESVADEVEALVFLSECGFLTPVYQDGKIYTDGNGSIYTL